MREERPPRHVPLNTDISSLILPFHFIITVNPLYHDTTILQDISGNVIIPINYFIKQHCVCGFPSNAPSASIEHTNTGEPLFTHESKASCASAAAIVRGTHGLKSNIPNRTNRPFWANRCSEPTKFLSCKSLSALLPKERLAIWFPC